jgi:hypothetical protein
MTNVDPDAGVGGSRRRIVQHHRIMLTLACVTVALVCALQELGDGRVALRGCPTLAIPQVCASRALLHVKCPGCGLTRSLIHLAEGDWRASWRCHRLGGLLALLIVLQAPYRVLALREPESARIPPFWQAALGFALIAVLLGNWLVELVSGRAFSF